MWLVDILLLFTLKQQLIHHNVLIVNQVNNTSKNVL